MRKTSQSWTCCNSEFRAFTLFRQDIYTYGKVKEDSKYEKERKILKDEVQQDGKNANTSQPGIEPGTAADAAGALPTELPGPGPKPSQNE